MLLEIVHGHKCFTRIRIYAIQNKENYSIRRLCLHSLNSAPKSGSLRSLLLYKETSGRRARSTSGTILGLPWQHWKGNLQSANFLTSNSHCFCVRISLNMIALRQAREFIMSMIPWGHDFVFSSHFRDCDLFEGDARTPPFESWTFHNSARMIWIRSLGSCLQRSWMSGGRLWTVTEEDRLLLVLAGGSIDNVNMIPQLTKCGR